MFSTQIALMHRGELVLGVSYASAFGEMAWAVRGGGAWLDGNPIRVAAIDQLAQATLSTGNLKSLAASAGGWQRLAELVQQVSRIRGYGDFFHYHLLARGALDLVIESDVNILDIAALAVIVREAGGVFTDLDGAPLNLQTRSVLAGKPTLHAQVQNLMRHWRPLPIIHAIHDVDYGGRFQIEQLDLEFSNGARRRFERMKPRGFGGVVIAALRDEETVLLTREYAAGLHQYLLGLPTGRIDPGESALQAANRELKEEAGFGARRLTVLREFSMSPTFFNQLTTLVLAEDLYDERLPGDEPEPLDVVLWRLDELDQLMLREDCSDGRALAALFIVREYLRLRANP